MKYLVVGGAGFIGTYLTDELLTNGHEVVILDDLSNSKEPKMRRNLEFYGFDVGDIDVIEKPKSFDGIFHLATHPRYESITDPHKNVETNADGMVSVLEYAKKANCKVVYASNSGIADISTIPITEDNKDNPTTPYDATKLFGEHLCKIYYNLHGVKSVILRFATVYGRNQKVSSKLKWFPVIATMIKCAKEENKVWITGDGTQTRDFIYVTDVVDALVKAMHSGMENAEKLLIGTNIETNMNRIHQIIEEQTKKHIKIDWKEPIKGNMPRNCLDNSKAMNELDWEPRVDVKTGIRMMLE